MHYYKKNIGDYHKKAGRLTMLQHGAYTLLMDACYDREEFPTIEAALEWVWASSEDEIQAVKFVLSKFFDLIDGVYIQNRIERELEGYQKNAKTNQRIALEREAKRRQAKRLKESTKRDENSTKREPTVNESLGKQHEAPPNYELLTTNHKPLTTNQELIPKETMSAKANETLEIFNYWKEVMKKNGSSKLIAKRDKAIKARLKEGYTVDEIKLAILGCSMTPHNMGQNDNGKKYDDIELICRNAANLERFMESKPLQAQQQSTDFAGQQSVDNWADGLENEFHGVNK